MSIIDNMPYTNFFHKVIRGRDDMGKYGPLIDKAKLFLVGAMPDKIWKKSNFDEFKFDDLIRTQMIAAVDSGKGFVPLPFPRTMIETPAGAYCIQSPDKMGGKIAITFVHSLVEYDVRTGEKYMTTPEILKQIALQLIESKPDLVTEGMESVKQKVIDSSPCLYMGFVFKFERIDEFNEYNEWEITTYPDTCVGGVVPRRGTYEAFFSYTYTPEHSREILWGDVRGGMAKIIITNVCNLLWFIDCPQNFIIRESVNHRRRKQWTPATRPLNTKPVHIVKDDVAIRTLSERWKKDGILKVQPHFRRGHDKYLTHERYRFKRWQRIRVKSTIIGPREFADPKRSYKIMTQEDLPGLRDEQL